MVYPPPGCNPESDWKARVKICVITSQYGNFWSGLGTYATNLVNGLADAGHEVSVICPSVERTHPAVTFLDSSAITAAPTMSNWIQLARQTGKLVQHYHASLDFDVIHFADAREALFCQSRSALVVGTMNDYYFAEAPGNPLYYRKYYSDWILRWLFYNVSRLVEKRALRKLPLVIANTDYVRNSVVNNYGVASDKACTVYYGLGKPPQNSVPGVDKLPGSPALLFVGSNFQRKGLPCVIRALARVVRHYPDCMLHVVGKDAKQAAMQTLANALGLNSNVIFHGGKDNLEVQQLYGKADVFVMPSLIEGFGLVFLEAMAAAVPVIGGQCGGTPELITNGKNGFVVPPDDHETLALRIIELVEHPALRQQMVLAGKESYALYSIDTMINQTVELYRRFKKS